jgi:hypothetical protein
MPPERTDLATRLQEVERERDEWRDKAEQRLQVAGEALELIAHPDQDWRIKPLDLEWASEIARNALDTSPSEPQEEKDPSIDPEEGEA